MFGTLLLGALISIQGQAPELNESTFAKWRDYLKPSAQETSFCDLDWKPTFWQAVLEAQTKDKPVLLWAMNGHPLGCT